MTYEIVNKEKVIGNLTVQIEENDKSCTYTVKSQVKLPFNISYSYTLKSAYFTGILISSSVQSYINKKIHRSSSTVNKGTNYLVTIDGQKSVFNDQIAYSEALVYVLEPVNKTKIYSDFSGEYKSIKNLGYHKYRLTNHKNGNTSVYKYKNGILTNAKIDYGALEFSLQLK